MKKKELKRRNAEMAAKVKDLLLRNKDQRAKLAALTKIVSEHETGDWIYLEGKVVKAE